MSRIKKNWCKCNTQFIDGLNVVAGSTLCGSCERVKDRLHKAKTTKANRTKSPKS